MKKAFTLMCMITIICIFFASCDNKSYDQKVIDLRKQFEKTIPPKPSKFKSKSKPKHKPEPQHEHIMQCSICIGAGYTTCMMCNGTGSQLQPQVNYYTNSIYYIQVPCTFCNGKGTNICSYCNGKGSIVLSTPPNPYISPANPYTNQNHHSSNSQLVRETCTFCNGSGKNPAKEYGPDYTGSGDVTIKYCPVCQTSGPSHYHTACPSCLGLGYNEVYKYK